MDQDVDMTDAPCATTHNKNHTVCHEGGAQEYGDVGHISDDSSFYGDDDHRAALERRAAEYDPSSYWRTAHLSLSAIAAAHRHEQSSPASHSKPLYNPHEGNLKGRQLSESIPEFLARLPPSSTLSSVTGPWIWIANPYCDTRPLQQDLAGLMEDGTRLLEECCVTMAEKEVALAGRPQSLLARQQTAVRKTVTDSILAAAQRRGVTTGKWMLFPTPSDVDTVWRVVADATASGQLGCGAKVATNSEAEDEENTQGRQGFSGARLVCVYTIDFADVADVQRVVRKLDQLGLVKRKGPWGGTNGIYYKCDAFTHLGIESKNQWGLQASRYSSREILSLSLSKNSDPSSKE